MRQPLIKTMTYAASAISLLATSALADPMTVTDIAGREVTLSDNPSRIILGEGRMMYAVAPLATNDPFENILS